MSDQATGLRPILNGLNAAEQGVFIPEYQARLDKAYPMKQDGTVLYPFRRLFLVMGVG
jgi:trans-aconitate 2-methyltransferase